MNGTANDGLDEFYGETTTNGGQIGGLCPLKTAKPLNQMGRMRQ
jgi:hypothetical protein